MEFGRGQQDAEAQLAFYRPVTGERQEQNVNDVMVKVAAGAAVGALLCLAVLAVIAFSNGEEDAALVAIGVGVFSVACLLFGTWARGRRR